MSLINKQTAKLLEFGDVYNKELRASAHIKYKRLVDAHTIRCDNNFYYRTIRLEGFSYETADDEEINVRKIQRNHLLRTLDSRSDYTLYYHIIRRRIKKINPHRYTTPFIDQLNRRYCEKLNQDKLYLNQHYLTIVKKPGNNAQQKVEKIRKYFFKDDNEGVNKDEEAAALRSLDEITSKITTNLKRYSPSLLGVYETENGLFSQQLEFLFYLINGWHKPVMVPYQALNTYLPSAHRFYGSETMELRPPNDRDSIYAAMITIKEYMGDTNPNFLNALLQIPHEFVVTNAFTPIPHTKAKESIQLQIDRYDAADDDAKSLLQELTEAKDAVASGRVGHGLHHFSVMCKGKNNDDLQECITRVDNALDTTAGIFFREASGLEPAFWAQLPGNLGYLGRPGEISTKNFASFISMHDYPSGQMDGNPWGEFITFFKTESSTPYAFNLHVLELFNFVLIGMSGGGKTVWYSFVCALCEKYGIKLTLYDFYRGAEIFIRALGGEYEILRPGISTGFNPYQLPDTKSNRAFLRIFTALLAESVTPDQEKLSLNDKRIIKNAIERMYTYDVNDRRLGNIIDLFKGHERDHEYSLYRRLSVWCGEGEHAWLFDNEHDTVAFDAQYLGFDMTEILDQPETATPAMSYMFHINEIRKYGGRSLNVIDEGWKALDIPYFERKIRTEEKTIRKRDGGVGLVTQDPEDIATNKIASTILNQSPTRVFFPKHDANQSDYAAFGLTDKEIQIIKHMATDQGKFLLKQGEVSVIAQIDLTGMNEYLAVLSGNEKRLAHMERCIAEHGENPAQWLPHFMKHYKETS